MNLRDNQQNHKIAITGIASILPGSQNCQQFWETIVKGRDMIRDTPESHWRIKDYYDPSRERDMSVYVKTGGFLDPVPFDPMEFGMPPNMLPVTDTVQLLSLIATRDVLNDTLSYAAGKVDKKRVGIILGVAAGTEGIENMSAKAHWPEMVNAMRANGIEESLAQKIAQETRDSFGTWNENTFPGLLANVVAGRVANRFDLGGTNCTMDAACASSLAAIKNAVQELQLGNADMVISGGADALNSIFMYMCFNQTGALSKTGDCRAFDGRGDGTILGEGLAFFTLKRLEDAISDGDRVYAVLAGMGSSSDGRSKSIYAPDSNGQAQAIKRAHEIAGTSPADVELIEAHGTGTVAGDYAEFNGLKLAFGDHKKTQFCALGSVKSQIGHTKSTAGAASLQKAVLALYNRVIPPTIKVEQPNERMDIRKSPFYLNTEPRPWTTNKEIRRAGVSSFGFGGTNFHCIVEEFPEKDHKNHYVPGKELILLSSEDKPSLREKVEELDRLLESDEVSSVARKCQLSFDASQPHRLAVISASKHDFFTIRKTLLDLLSNGKTSFEIPNQVYYSSEKLQPGVALLCSGQGSQYLHMGRELLNQFPAAFDGYSTCSDLTFDDLRISEVTFPISTFTEADRKADEERLNDTRWAQPAIGSLTVSHKHLLESVGLAADMIGGHSYGELSALYWSGVIKTSHDLIHISRKRGELMAGASSGQRGAMTAVFAGGEDTVQLIAQAKSPLEVANYNSPDQTVVSGRMEDIEAFEKFLSEADLGYKRLPVSTAFHSKLVAGSAADFGKYLEGFAFGKPTVEVFSNETGKPYAKGKKAIISALAGQLSKPVRFTDEIAAMYQAGARIFLEVGPGNHLTNLAKRILDQKDVRCISLDGSKTQSGKEAFWVAMGQLSVAGVPLKFDRLWHRIVDFHPEKRDYSPITVEITGANYERPYPAKTGIHAPVAQQAKSDAPLWNKEEKTERPVVPDHQTASRQMSTPPEPKKDHSRSSENKMQSDQPKSTLKRKMNKHNQVPTSPEWMKAFTQIQQNMHNSQMEFMRMMMENQKQFMQLSAGLLSPRSRELQSPEVSWMTDQAASSPADQECYVNPYPEGAAAPEALYQEAESAPGPAFRPREREQVAEDTAVTKSAPQPGTVQPNGRETRVTNLAEVENKLVEIVAEKTGYPADLLDLDAHLESGLGIDSIKRVQILSSLQNTYEELRDVDNTQLAKMNSLREILDYSAQYFREGKSVASKEVAEAATPDKQTVPEKANDAAPDIAQLEKALIEIVADKTGYPSELLDFRAPLESGLGIDSIKRVQILSTFQGQFPGLKEADNTKLAKMNTLAEIVSYFHSEFADQPETAKKKSPASNVVM